VRNWAAQILRWRVPARYYAYALEVARLLLPFQRLGADRMTLGQGAGLGLSIVQAIADAHDADMMRRSSPSRTIKCRT
jgi:light-regulated signal transduction histidine kinase (bacteriophytochrome)